MNVVSGLRFKIKAKRRHRDITLPNHDCFHFSPASYQLVLAESFDKFDQSSSINA